MAGVTQKHILSPIYDTELEGNNHLPFELYSAEIARCSLRVPYVAP